MGLGGMDGWVGLKELDGKGWQGMGHGLFLLVLSLLEGLQYLRRCARNGMDIASMNNMLSPIVSLLQVCSTHGGQEMHGVRPSIHFRLLCHPLSCMSGKWQICLSQPEGVTSPRFPQSPSTSHSLLLHGRDQGRPPSPPPHVAFEPSTSGCTVPESATHGAAPIPLALTCPARRPSGTSAPPSTARPSGM